MKINFTIPGTPVTKKNHQQIKRNRKTGKPFISQSDGYKSYEERCGYYIPNKWAMLEGHYNVKCVYYMPTKRRVDLLNLLGATCDILTHYGVIKDDNSAIVVSHDGSRVLYDKENPRVEIAIEEAVS